MYCGRVVEGVVAVVLRGLWWVVLEGEVVVVVMEGVKVEVPDLKASIAASCVTSEAGLGYLASTMIKSGVCGTTSCGARN